jgi:hypothetical protein
MYPKNMKNTRTTSRLILALIALMQLASCMMSPADLVDSLLIPVPKWTEKPVPSWPEPDKKSDKKPNPTFHND